jgi:glucose/arabinose dehydrogenase/mono/diheme cytochrome c family protein
MTSRLLALLLLPLFVVSSGFAQNGDKPGHDMSPPPEEWNLPAPVLAPDKALQSFQFGETGFSLELVAAEPLIIHPVAIAFDGNGRAWVCEMRGYMPDVDGHGEDQPTGRISILLDKNDDGQADEAKVFLDGLVLPRALQFVKDGLIWGDQEKLYLTKRQGPGGLEAGETTVLDDQWAPGGSVEHKSNGLAYNLDNWIYNAKSEWRYRYQDGKLAKERTEFRGQWGLSQDDQGRILANTNSSLVAMDTVPPGYSVRNPNHKFAGPATVKMANDVFPIRITCGVNRGYMKGTLDERGFLKSATASGGLTIYRGDNFPPEYRGNAFIPEPAGLLLKRAILSDDANGIPVATQAYTGKEFLASTDERSRLVNTFTAPDGTLYLVDLYHGIVQHREFVTTYLRNQIIKRELDKHNETGRIYRIRWSEKARGPLPRMEEETPAQLVAHLSHPNGWWRDTAQRILVQSGDASVAPQLRDFLISETATPLTKVHALWTLEGMGQLQPADVKVALASSDPNLQSQTYRVAETFSSTPAEAEIVPLVAGLKATSSAVLRQQIASLGVFRGPGQTVAREAWATLASMAPAKDPLFKDMAMSGVAGSELDILEFALARDLPLVPELIRASAASLKTPDAMGRLIAALTVPQLAPADQSKYLTLVAQNVASRRQAAACATLLDKTSAQSAWRDAVLKGFIAAGKTKGFKKIPLAPVPALLADPGEDKTLQAAAAIFDLSGKAPANYLTKPEHHRLYEIGKTEFLKLCATCHHPEGKGMETLAPPLLDSQWVLGPPKRLTALVMEGLMGPIDVNGTLYDVPKVQPVMPGIRFNPELSDEEIAGILTYIRHSWENAAPPVDPAVVKEWRESQGPRAPFTAQELLEIQ